MCKLEYRNNWESDEYYVLGEQIRDLKTVAINEVFYPVTSRMVEVDYSDHGHRYTSTSKHYFITSQDLGVEVDLNIIVRKNTIVAVDYEL